MELAMRALTLIAAAAVLAACAGQAGADGKITISKAVAADFETYKQSIGTVGSGVYAVTEDGQGAAGAGCRGADCMAPNKARKLALDKCAKMNPGRNCVVFAKNLDAVVEYQVGE